MDHLKYFSHIPNGMEIVEYSFLVFPGFVSFLKDGQEEFLLSRIVLGPDYHKTNRKIEIFINTIIYLSMVDSVCDPSEELTGKLRIRLSDNVELRSLGAVYLCGLHVRKRI